MVERHSAGAQRFGQNVGSRAHVLDGEIDSDATDRRHCVSGVADGCLDTPEKKPADKGA